MRRAGFDSARFMGEARVPIALPEKWGRRFPGGVNSPPISSQYEEVNRYSHYEFHSKRLERRKACLRSEARAAQSTQSM